MFLRIYKPAKADPGTGLFNYDVKIKMSLSDVIINHFKRRSDYEQSCAKTMETESDETVKNNFDLFTKDNEEAKLEDFVMEEIEDAKLEDFDSKPAAVLKPTLEQKDLVKLNVMEEIIRLCMHNGSYVIKLPYVQDVAECQRLQKLNKDLFKRKFLSNSRPCIKAIGEKPLFTNAVRELFFNSDGSLIATLKEELKTSSLSFINFDMVSKDKRIMVTLDEHKGTQSILQCMKFLLTEYGIIDPAKEIIYDVSLLIGGTVNQQLHTDSPRIMGGFIKKGQNKKQPDEFVERHEINREEYNNDMMGQWSPASIILDMTTRLCGINLGVTNKVIMNCSDNEVSIKYGYEGDIFKVVSKDNHGTIVNVEGAGVIFAGDFPHFGVRNVNLNNVSLNTSMNKLFKEIAKTSDQEAYGILENTPGINEYCRLFLKTIPKDNEFKIYDLPHVGIVHDENDWDDYGI